jgi:hypothetical protein
MNKINPEEREVYKVFAQAFIEDKVSKQDLAKMIAGYIKNETRSFTTFDDIEYRLNKIERLIKRYLMTKDE